METNNIWSLLSMYGNKHIKNTRNEEFVQSKYNKYSLST